MSALHTLLNIVFFRWVRQPWRWSPVVPSSGLHAPCNPLCGLDPLLINRIWQKLHAPWDQVIIDHDFYLPRSFRNKEAHVARNWGSLWPSASKDLSSSVQYPMRKKIYICVYPMRNWILPTSTCFSSLAFRWDSSPSWHLVCSLVRDPEPQDPAKPWPDPWPMGTHVINTCCSKLLSFGIACYAAIAN